MYLFRRKHWKINELYSSNRKNTRIDKNGKEITKNICKDFEIKS